MDTAKRYLKHFCNFEKLGFQTEKHGSHRLCLTANQLPTAKATGSSWCIVCVEPTDSERVQPPNRKCKLEGNNKQFKTKTKSCQSFDASRKPGNSFLLITLVLFKISAQNLVCLLLTLSTTNCVS